jgi:hypothetical protein
MAAITDHPAFIQPTDASEKIWRYMDFAKLVSLFDSSSLYFPRLDQLSDPFEGSLSKAEYEHWKSVAEQGELEGNLPAHWKGRYLDVLLGNARRAKRAIYINCWHRSAGESEAMWNLYASSGYGVAVQSTYDRLVATLPSAIHNGCYAGIVRYTDHHTESMPGGNIFYAVTHKRRAFEHEKEMRAIVWLGDLGFDVDPDQSANPIGLSIPITLAKIIEAVYVSPAAPPWFTDAVRGVVRQYGGEFPVRQSDLAGPAYL